MKIVMLMGSPNEKGSTVILVAPFCLWCDGGGHVCEVIDVNNESWICVYTLNSIFKEARFNGWTQGELFVVSDKLVSNARRDDFEQNEAYDKLIEPLQQGVGLETTKAIREASILRSDITEKQMGMVYQSVLEEGQVHHFSYDATPSMSLSSEK